MVILIQIISKNWKKRATCFFCPLQQSCIHFTAPPKPHNTHSSCQMTVCSRCRISTSMTYSSTRIKQARSCMRLGGFFLFSLLSALRSPLSSLTYCTVQYSTTQYLTTLVPLPRHQSHFKRGKIGFFSQGNVLDSIPLHAENWQACILSKYIYPSIEAISTQFPFPSPNFQLQTISHSFLLLSARGTPPSPPLSSSFSPSHSQS